MTGFKINVRRRGFNSFEMPDLGRRSMAHGQYSAMVAMYPSQQAA